MKLKYIVNARIPTEKAHGYQICKMCEEFALAGAEVELLAPTRGNSISEDAFSYYGLKRNFTLNYIKSFDFIRFDRLLFRKSVYLQSLWFLVKLAFKKIDKNAIVYTRNPEIVWLFAKKNFTVFDAHSWPESKNLIYKKLLKNVGAIVCNSKGTEKKYQEQGFGKTIAAPNGVDLSLFLKRKDKKILRKDLGLPEEKKIIMYVGHLYKWKGVDTIIGTAEKLKARKDILFLAIGGTEKDVLKYKKLVQDKAMENINFLGHKDKKLIPNYLLSADVLLLPNVPVSVESLEYTSPIKMFEYMAAGNPIVASDLPSIREILNDDIAYFCRPGDADNLSKKVVQVINDPDGARLKAERSQEKVLEYTWDKRAGRILEFIEKSQ